MIKFKIFIFLTCSIVLASCEFDEPVTEIEPTTTTVDSFDEDFIIQGSVDGEPFEIRHESLESINVPVQFPATWSSSNPKDYIGTSFAIRTPSSHNEQEIMFGISKNDSSDFDDIIKVGTHPWYDGWNHVPIEGAASIIFFKGGLSEERQYSHMFPSENNPNDFFEISSITQLETGENTLPEFAGNLYKIEGSFEVDIVTIGQEYSRLKVEYFSALILDTTAK